MAAKIKLLSSWFGDKPYWFPKFEAQMKRFDLVDWECFPPPEITYDRQIGWMNDLASSKLGFPCSKATDCPILAMCDYRPAYAEIFPEKYEGYEWWGWCDLDVMMGDLDGLLAPILKTGCEVLNLKPKYLSSCFMILRNTPRMQSVYRTSPMAKTILSESRYHVWDESGYKFYPGQSFYNVLLEANVRMLSAPYLYSYDSLEDRNTVEYRDGKLFAGDDGREVLFHHFMSDVWPVKE